MSQESQRIPIDEKTEEIAVRITDGNAALVLVDHEGREEVVSVRMQPQPAKVAA
jgi:hypothetical protein